MRVTVLCDFTHSGKEYRKGDAADFSGSRLRALEAMGRVRPDGAAPRSSCEDGACEDRLREKAAALGVKPHHAAGKEKIKGQIEEAEAKAKAKEGE